MPYNFQGAGGIINTGPIEDIYYLDPVTFTQSLVPNNDSDAATKFYVDRHILEIMDSEIFDPNLVISDAIDGRIEIAVMPQDDGTNNVVLTVANLAIDTAQLATNAVTRDKIVDGEVTLVKLNADVSVNALLTQSPPTEALRFNTQQLKDLAAPTDNTDAVTKAYVDAAVDTEIGIRFGVDSELEARLDSEILERIAGDSDLQMQIDTLDLGSAVFVNDVEVEDPNFIDGTVLFTVVDSDITANVDETVIATRDYVDSEIIQHLIDSVGVLGGNGIETSINANDTEVIAIDADTEFFQFNDATQLTLVPGSLTGGAGGLLDTDTVRGINIADNTITATHINDNAAGEGIRIDTNNWAGLDKISVEFTTDGGLQFDDVTQSILGVETIVNRTLSVDTGIIATRTYVDDAIDDLIDGAPAALDTLNELSEALNDDSDFGATVVSALQDVNARLDSDALALETETENRIQGDMTLQEQIDSEKLLRAAGDSDLQMQIDNLPDSDTQYLSLIHISEPTRPY